MESGPCFLMLEIQREALRAMPDRPPRAGILQRLKYRHGREILRHNTKPLTRWTPTRRSGIALSCTSSNR